MKVDVYTITNLGLPLNSFKSVCRRGDSKKKLRQLENKYHFKTDDVCKVYQNPLNKRLHWQIYENYAYFGIDMQDKRDWTKYYVIYVSSSLLYKLMILMNIICGGAKN